MENGKEEEPEEIREEKRRISREDKRLEALKMGGWEGKSEHGRESIKRMERKRRRIMDRSEGNRIESRLKMGSLR